MTTNETAWNLWAQPSVQERGVLDLLGHGLKRAYGEPERDALPENLRELIHRLERATLHTT